MTARLRRGMSRVSFGESFDETKSPQIEDQMSLEEDEESNKKYEEPDKQMKVEERKRILPSNTSNTTPTSSFEKRPVFGLATFFTLKLLIFDFGLSLADVSSDFAQVCLLLYTLLWHKCTLAILGKIL